MPRTVTAGSSTTKTTCTRPRVEVHKKLASEIRWRDALRLPPTNACNCTSRTPRMSQSTTQGPAPAIMKSTKALARNLEYPSSQTSPAGVSKHPRLKTSLLSPNSKWREWLRIKVIKGRSAETSSAASQATQSRDCPQVMLLCTDLSTSLLIWKRSRNSCICCIQVQIKLTRIRVSSHSALRTERTLSR